MELLLLLPIVGYWVVTRVCANAPAFPGNDDDAPPPLILMELMEQETKELEAASRAEYERTVAAYLAQQAADASNPKASTD